MHTQQYSSRLTAILTMAGVAIGLGNVWRFPYMMGQHGGSAFLIMYLALMVIFAVPVLMAEWALGRETGAETVGAFTSALGPAGKALGVLLVLGIAIADSYYMVVIGNILFSAGYAAVPGFAPERIDRYTALLGDGTVQYAFALAVLGAGLWVIHRGLQRGIETVSRLFVPFFGVVVIYLVISTLTLPGALSGLAEFMAPDFSRIGASELFAAAGQACFSLGIGGTFMVIYGSYLQRESSIPRDAVITGLADTGAALLAGLFIVPAVLAFGLDMAGGPTLIFHTLPELFAVMPGGRFVGFAFLLALTFMAFLSAVAGLNVCAGALHRVPGLTARRALLLLAVVEAVLMFPSAHSPALIGTLDLIFGSGFQVFGALIAVIALTWGLGSQTVRRALLTALPERIAGAVQFWLKWVIPLLLTGILLGYILENL